MHVGWKISSHSVLINIYIQNRGGKFYHRMLQLTDTSRKELYHRLPEASNTLNDLFSEYMEPFSKVKTPYLQLAYYRDHFHFIVSLS